MEFVFLMLVFSSVSGVQDAVRGRLVMKTEYLIQIILKNVVPRLVNCSVWYVKSLISKIWSETVRFPTGCNISSTI